MYGRSLYGNREISRSTARDVKGWSASGRRGAVADDARAGEVRPLHSSGEADEQLRGSAGGVGGGVLEDGQWSASETGTPQGAVVSPLLSNIYLHYAFDLWAERWRRHEARGHVILVRYADDILAGFEHEGEAERFQVELRERVKKFALSLHPDKTGHIDFGRG